MPLFLGAGDSLDESAAAFLLDDDDDDDDPSFLTLGSRPDPGLGLAWRLPGLLDESGLAVAFWKVGKSVIFYRGGGGNSSVYFLGRVVRDSSGLEERGRKSRATVPVTARPTLDPGQVFGLSEKIYV